MKENKLVTIGRYSQAVDAYLDKGLLESCGIECFIQDQYLISANWMFSNAIGGVKLQIKTSDVELVKDILKEREPFEVKNVESGKCCIKCKSDRVYFEKFSRKIGFASFLFFGIPLLFLKRKWKCLNCGYEWRK